MSYIVLSSSLQTMNSINCGLAFEIDIYDQQDFRKLFRRTAMAWQKQICWVTFHVKIILVPRRAVSSLARHSEFGRLAQRTLAPGWFKFNHCASGSLHTALFTILQGCSRSDPVARWSFACAQIFEPAISHGKGFYIWKKKNPPMDWLADHSLGWFIIKYNQ
jgi:hypothetical protein